MESADPADLVPAGGVIAGFERGGHNAGGRVRRMDKQVVPDIDPQVADIIAAGVETEHVPGLEIRGVDVDPVGEGVVRNPAGGIAELAVDILDKAGAVKTGLGRIAAPFVRGAHILEGVGGNLFAELGAGCMAELSRGFETAFFDKGGGDIALLAVDDHTVPVV